MTGLNLGSLEPVASNLWRRTCGGEPREHALNLKNTLLIVAALGLVVLIKPGKPVRPGWGGRGGLRADVGRFLE